MQSNPIATVTLSVFLDAGVFTGLGADRSDSTALCQEWIETSTVACLFLRDLSDQDEKVQVGFPVDSEFCEWNGY